MGLWPNDSALARRHEVRFAHRLLEAHRALSEADAQAPPVREELGTEGEDAASFTIARDGSWIRLPSGEVVSMSKRATARRVLARLVATLDDIPPGPIDIDEVFEAGWPGDCTPEPHRSNRVYVLIRRLRSVGLAPALVHDGEGYRLEPAVGLKVAS